MKIGVLTGGGDAPGLNAVLRAIVKAAVVRHGSEVVGVRNGFGGLLTPPEIRRLSLDDVRGLVRRGGTILGTSTRNNPFLIQGRDRSREVLESVRWLGLDALIVIGGEGSLGIAKRFADLGVPIIGVPKTIENDLAGTDVTFGWDTAVATAAEAIDKLQTTGESHHRVMFLEVSGRHAGWVALASGLSGGADVILVPEIPYRVEKIVEKIERRRREGRDYTIVVVSEGAFEAGAEAERREGSHGAAEVVGRKVGAATGLEWRTTVLGHLQHGGVPTPTDRILATRLGIAAVSACHSKSFGTMVAVRGHSTVPVPLDQVVGKLRRIEPRNELVLDAKALGISLAADLPE
jgi:6-phosphofructokinase 1